MYLTKSQDRIVSLLLDEYIKKERKIIDFCAPTGSGKTFMASNLISRIFAQNQINKLNKTMIIIATLSNAKLPIAFAKKINEYMQYLPFKNFDVEFRESPSSTKNLKIEHIKGFHLENNKVIIFGTSSFGKKKLFTELGLLNNFIVEAKEKKWNIIYIRDEAHKGGATNRETAESFYKRFDDKMVDLASFTIQMTATPKGNNDLIELKKEDLLNDNLYLLKNKSVYNDFQKNTFNSEELMDAAIENFKNIQNDYKKINEFIRPALLIQVDSKNKLISQQEYDKTIDIIKQKLIKNNLKYLKYFSNDIEGNAKEELSLESASKKDSNYDVIIFKVGPATGWDIPRACMLLQIREVSSESLNIQTLGRIKRNPIKGLKKNAITDRYFVYSNYQEGKRSMASYKLKDMFKAIKFYQGNLSLDKKTRSILENDYVLEIKKILKSSFIKNLIKENNKKTKLIIDEKRYSSDSGTTNYCNLYKSSIFSLKIWNDQIILKNKKYFTDGINNIIDNYSNDLQISKEIIIYTIITQSFNKLKEFYTLCYKKQESNEKYEIILDKHLPNNYQIWKVEQEKNIIDVTEFKKYGYKLIKNMKDINQKNIQYLDSYPEKLFMEKLIEEINEEKYDEKISFFTKMQSLPSEIYFEYFSSKDAEKHKSYIDFIIKYNEKILMIEVKGWNDYDSEKTEDLLKSFAKYEKSNPEVPIKLMICYAGKENGKRKTPKIISLNNKKDGSTIRTVLKEFFASN